MTTLKLVSHHLCPYVQRARIVLEEKSVRHDLVFVDLAAKPDWFKAISPLGKVPVLLVDDRPLFESAAIAEYLDEVTPGSLLPADPFERARQRGWVAFASSTLDNIARFYSVTSEARWEGERQALVDKFRQIEAVLGAGPLFAGAGFSLVDAAFAPVFRYFEVIDEFTPSGFFASTPAVSAWRAELAVRPSVIAAAVPGYHGLLRDFLVRRQGHLASLIGATEAA